MVNAVRILERALKDSVVEKLDLITEDRNTINSLLYNYPKAKYFSEWFYEMAGQPKFVYRIHENGIGKKLYELHLRGINSNLPKLTGVYSRKRLSDLVSDRQ